MSCREILFCQNRNTCILNSAAEGIAFQCFYSSLHAFLTHNIRILSHGAEQVSVVDQVHNCVRFIKADTDDLRAARSLDGITGTSVFCSLSRMKMDSISASATLPFQPVASWRI